MCVYMCVWMCLSDPFFVDFLHTTSTSGQRSSYVTPFVTLMTVWWPCLYVDDLTSLLYMTWFFKDEVKPPFVLCLFYVCLSFVPRMNSDLVWQFLKGWPVFCRSLWPIIIGLYSFVVQIWFCIYPFLVLIFYLFCICQVCVLTLFSQYILSTIHMCPL